MCDKRDRPITWAKGGVGGSFSQKAYNDPDQKPVRRARRWILGVSCNNSNVVVVVVVVVEVI